MQILGLVNSNLAPNSQATGLPDSMFASVLPCDGISYISRYEATNTRSCTLKANQLEIRAQMQSGKIQERDHISQCGVDSGSFYFLAHRQQEVCDVAPWLLHTEAMQNTLLSRYIQ